MHVHVGIATDVGGIQCQLSKFKTQAQTNKPKRSSSNNNKIATATVKENSEDSEVNGKNGRGKGSNKQSARTNFRVMVSQVLLE